MIKMLGDFLFALEPLRKNFVLFRLGMRNFQGHRFSCFQVNAAKHRRGVALRNDALQAVLIDLFARMNRSSFRAKNQVYLRPDPASLAVNTAVSGPLDSAKHKLIWSGGPPLDGESGDAGLDAEGSAAT